MFHLDNNSGVSAMPPLGAVQSSAPRWFTEGGGGVPASYPGAAWFNMIQAELLNLCAAYGISPDKANLNQLKLAIEAAVNQRAPLASPAFSGVPTAPTASQSTNNTQIATTAFVKAALAALVDSSPAALDTLNELAAALGNDPNFATTMTNALANKQAKDATLTALSGKDVAGLLTYLGLGNLKYGAPLIGELVEWPLEQMPQEIWSDCGMEFIPYIAQSFDGTKYPLLSQLHPTNVLPADMRAYVARGWDNGRGVDTGRTLMSAQGDAIRNITGSIASTDAYALFWTGTKTASGVFGTTSASKTYANSTTGSGSAISELSIDASKTVPTAAENRVKTVAWNFIVRAK